MMYKFLFLIGLLFWFLTGQSATTIYLLRHAEKQSNAGKDPELNAQGYHRAEHIADMLSSAPIKRVYATDYKRTQLTAEPIAQRHGLDVVSYNPSDLPAFVDQLEAVNGTVVVVGHSNTTPQLLNLISGLNYPQLDEEEYDTLFQLTQVNEGQWQLQSLKTLPFNQQQVKDKTSMINFVTWAKDLDSAGMPTRAHMKDWAHYGYDLVVNLAPPNSKGSLKGEAAGITALGGRYINIPVDWNNPTADDFDAFVTAMNSASEGNKLVHCQMNMRATIFTFLYQVIQRSADPSEAYAQVAQVWQPNEIWRTFTKQQLQRFNTTFKLPEHKSSD